MMGRCRECGQGAIVRDAIGPICADCIEEGYGVNEIYAPEPTRADLPAADEQALANPKVQALVEALDEVKRDCILRAVNGVVPLGFSCWQQLCAALADLEDK